MFWLKWGPIYAAAVGVFIEVNFGSEFLDIVRLILGHNRVEAPRIQGCFVVEYLRLCIAVDFLLHRIYE